MRLTENAKTLLSMGCYLAICHVAAALIMQIEYSGLTQSKTCDSSESLPTDVVASYIKSFMNKNLSLKINTTDVNLMVNGLNKYLGEIKKCAIYDWKRDIGWETYMRWHYFITVTVSTVGNHLHFIETFSRLFLDQSTMLSKKLVSIFISNAHDFF